MKKLETRKDIEQLVNSFYAKVIKDEKIASFFTDIAKVDWDKHLPKMYSFWESILFGQMTYKGNPMGAHFPINEIKAMEQEHFDQWLSLWAQTVEENFAGENADLAIYKAQNIAKLMAFKMELARRL
ncbi:MAG: sec-independent protein translocase TatC [Chryseobacterium sp.]|uniref:group III truncated hemoglobin n=1 Tax=Chryseobacterium sp. TaxID=1871047 RepID=UPI000DB72D9E|nr:group III truncated hemoglobin [Chryseobacterium sp.]MPS64001.1 group III truncated hemoglobin [Chryseobacterium sp.]PZU23368.1 MAG: sec-independent protein translocase TatC [Chryseobacterium sp.]